MDCDVERTKMMERIEEISAIDDSKMDADEKAEMGAEMSKCSQRLNDIGAEETESKAIKILTGIGF